MVLWRRTRPSKTNTQKRCPFHHRWLECKSSKSRGTWNSRQIWPWNTEWSKAKANRALPRKRTSQNKHPLPTTQEKTLHMDITRWSIPKSDWLYSLQPKMEKLYIVSKGKKKKKKKDKELTVVQIMNSLLPNSDLNWRKLGKALDHSGYDLNKIAYDYTVEVTNGFKGLDLIECLKNYGQRFMTLYRRQGSRSSPRKRNAKRQNGSLRRPYK